MLQTNVPGGTDEAGAKTARSTLIKDATTEIKQPVGYYNAAHARAVSLVKKPAGIAREVRIYRTDGRTIVGLGQKGVIEAGISLERTWGIPIIPGSSLKGVTAATSHLLVESDSWRKAPKEGIPGESFAELFGTTEKRGKVIFHDAWWLPASEYETPLAHDIMTVHYANYYQGKDVVPDGTESPNPVSFITTRNAQQFVIALESTEADREWLAAAWQLLEKGLTELGVGAKTNAGYGRMTLDQKATDALVGTLQANLQEERDRADFEAADTKEQLSILIASTGSFYDKIRAYEVGTDPFELFSDSLRKPLFKMSPDAPSMFLAALSADPEWGNAIKKGKSLPGLGISDNKFKELRDRLGLVDAEASGELSPDEEITALASVHQSWIEAAKRALLSESREVVIAVRSEGKRHFGTRLKGEKDKLMKALDKHMKKLS